MANRLRDYTLSDPIFIDSNIFVYHQVAHPVFGPDSRDFLAKVEHSDIQAVTTNVVVNEVTYIVQLQRAANLLGTHNRGSLHAQMATDVSLATECWLAVEQFLSFLDALQHGGLTILNVETSDYRGSSLLGSNHRLFVSDATHVLICQNLDLVHIASKDADFDRVTFLARWEPGE